MQINFYLCNVLSWRPQTMLADVCKGKSLEISTSATGKMHRKLVAGASFFYRALISADYHRCLWRLNAICAESHPGGTFWCSTTTTTKQLMDILIHHLWFSLGNRTRRQPDRKGRQPVFDKRRRDRRSTVCCLWFVSTTLDCWEVPSQFPGPKLG